MGNADLTYFIQTAGTIFYNFTGVTDFVWVGDGRAGRTNYLAIRRFDLCEKTLGHAGWFMSDSFVYG